MKHQYGVYEPSEYYLHSAGWGTMAFIHGQMAGAIRLEAESAIVFECYFFNNSNLKGGAFYLNKNKKFEHQFVSIRNSIFSMNEAGDTGASIDLDKNILLISGDITNCYIFNNLAWRKGKIDFLFFNLFFW